MPYASLHNHCHFSIDGVGTVKDWVSTAIQKGLYGLGITDHGNCSAMLELYHEGKAQNFPVVLGSEFYAVKTLEKNKENRYNHMTVWVKNAEGYKNMCRLSTLSYEEEHFYYKPRITFEDLMEHSEGLMVGSGCMIGPLGQLNIKGKPEEAIELAKKFKAVFGDDFYLELMPVKVIDEETGENIQEKVNRFILDLAKKLDIKTIITADSHMPDASYKPMQDIKLANQSKGGKIWKMEDIYCMLTHDEFLESFKEHHSYMLDILPEAVLNTQEIVNKAKALELNFSPMLPDPRNERSVGSFIKEYGKIDLTDPVYVNRLKHEISVIRDNGKINLMDYFMILEEVCRWCRGNGIAVGPGRGSAAGSLLAYALNITQVDPIKHDLLFSRFLNEARIQKGTLPDIDLDFSDRDVVIGHLKERYGEDKVCKLGTITTLKLKSAFKDAMRAMMGKDFDYGFACSITKNLPDDLDSEENKEIFKQELLNNKAFEKFVHENKDILKTIVKMMGQARQMGVHASAVAITPCPLNEIIPMGMRKGERYTQYAAPQCEAVGVIKFDILKVNTLNYITKAVNLVKERHGVIIDPDNIPMGDRKTLDAFEAGDTDFVFQFNSNISKGLLTKIKINSLNDLSQVTAMGRPGPMDAGVHITWLNCKSEKVHVKYLHPSLEELLKPTAGVVCFQEQLMRAFQILAGFSEIEADDVRKATGKKIPELMQSFKEKFIKRSQEIHEDIDLNRAQDLWKQLETFGGYSFNASHSLCYALIGYVCQYLKMNYPIEWWAGVASGIINSTVSDKKAKLKEVYHVSKSIGMPDINESGFDFFINKNNEIISPFTVLNQIGDKSITSLLEVRKEWGEFTSLQDFLTKIKGKRIRKNVIESIIWGGCFSRIEPKNEKELIIEFYKSKIGKGTTAPAKKLQKELDTKILHMNEADIMRAKKSALSFLSGDLKNIYEDMAPNNTIYDYTKMGNMPDLREVTVIGTIKDVREIVTKKGDKMAFIEIENDDKTFSLTLFPESYIMYKEEGLLKKGQCMLVDGVINIWNGRRSIIAEKIMFLF